MKTKGLIVYALLLLQFASCNKSEVDDWQIKIGSVVQADIISKAPIGNSFTTNLPVGIYANNGTWLAGSSANWINNDNATALGTVGHPITFSSGPYYYPINGSVLNFYAFYPQAIESTAATAGVGPKVTHNITGQEDVMWASSSGYKIAGSPAVSPVLTFQHKLTELQFTFKAGSTYPASGDKVVSLLIKSQPTTVIMDVTTGNCTFSGSADMQALSLVNQSAGIAITSAGNNANSPIMTKPSTGSSAYTIDVVVKPANGSANITYTGELVDVVALEGYIQMVTLTFERVGINMTAQITAWNPRTLTDVTAQ